MSTRDATGTLASLFAMRLLTAEVQEMVEPMLDDFKAFLKPDYVVPNTKGADPLSSNFERKLQRIEGLLIEFAGGGLLDIVSSVAKSNRPATNALESYGNFVSALRFVAVALAHRVHRLYPNVTRPVRVTASALVRLIHIVLAGDIQVDRSYADRGLANIDVRSGKSDVVELGFPPLAPSLLDHVRGSLIPLDLAMVEVASLQAENALLRLAFQLTESSPLGNSHESLEYERLII